MRNILALLALLFTFNAYGQSSPAINVRFSSLVHSNGLAGVVVQEAADFTAVADSSGNLAGKYFTIHNAGDAICYAVWYKVSGSGSAPVVAGCTAVEVDIATDDTNSTVAGNTRTALNTTPYTNYFTITGATTHIIATSVLYGAATDGSVGTSGFSVSVTQGVSGAAAISPSSVTGDVQGWKICNNGVNTSTWLAVGSSIDPTVEGVRLDKGKCFECMQCTAGLLKAAKVSAQAASNGYSVIQYKQ